jgi:MFS family permease
MTLLGGVVSDKIGRTLTTNIGCGITIVWFFPMFALINTGDYPLIALAFIGLSCGLGMTYGPMSAMFAEMFPARVRYSGTSIGYAFGSIIGGAFAPTIATYLEDATGTIYSVSVYLLLMGLVGFITTSVTKDCTGAALKAGAGVIPGETKLEEAMKAGKLALIPH